MPNRHDMLSKLYSLGSGWPRGMRYLCATAIVLATGWMSLKLDIDQPYLLFFPAIFFRAAAFDRGSGFLATFLCALFTGQLLWSTHPTIRTQDGFGLALFVLVGLAVAWLVEALRRRVVELSKAKERSEKLAEERRVLMDELAHRTRNDLANVVTLLRLQGKQASAETKENLDAAADRVQTIAQVHRRLEVNDACVVVNSQHYLEDLCEDLRKMRLSGGLKLECKIESHSISMEKAVPLGLIVNELVTNAAKHAFLGKSSGRIGISFCQVGQCYHLCISDDGLGFDIRGVSTGLGQGLLHLLAAQLGADLKIGSNAAGTIASIDIPKHACMVKPQLRGEMGLSVTDPAGH